jgi:hypothetical protein
MRAITSPITLTKLMRVACWAVFILVVFASDGHAQQLRDLVRLPGANDLNDAISMTISSGTATVLVTGSNIFKQMGTTATAGGNVDVTLTAPGGGH